MRVIRENRTREARVTVRLHNFLKSVRNDLSFGRIKPQDGVFELVFRSSVEVLQYRSWGLCSFAAAVHIPERQQFPRRHVRGHTAAWVVRQPMSISGQDQVICEDHVQEVTQ